jgi:hypothetical protein
LAGATFSKSFAELGFCEVVSYLSEMSTTEQSLLQALLKLEDTVRALGTTSPKPDLRPIFDEVDRLTHQLPKGTDPQLLHYLHRKSYEKARLWLQGREAENQAGSCPHN